MNKTEQIEILETLLSAYQEDYEHLNRCLDRDGLCVFSTIPEVKRAREVLADLKRVAA